MNELKKTAEILIKKYPFYVLENCDPDNKDSLQITSSFKCFLTPLTRTVELYVRK